MNRTRARLRNKYNGLLSRLQVKDMNSQVRDDVLVEVITVVDQILDSEPRDVQHVILGIIQAELDKVKPRGPDLIEVIHIVSRARKGKE